MEIDGNNIKLSTGELRGEYRTAERDVGYLATFSIIIDSVATISSSLAFNSDATTRFNDSTTLRFTGEEVPGALSFEIRTSEDDVTWTSWATFKGGDFYGRYFQLKLIMTREAESVALVCTKFDYGVDLPDVHERGSEEVTVAGDGKSVSFTKTFHQEPTVNVPIVDGDGVYYRFAAKDTSGFTVKLYEADGTETTGNFEYHAYGV